MKRLFSAWRSHPILTIGFIFAVLFTVMFAVRSVVFTIYWANPMHHDRSVEGWMTPRYIARSWSLPDKVVIDALNLPALTDRRQTLADIAARQNVPVQALEQGIAEAAAKFRANSE